MATRVPCASVLAYPAPGHGARGTISTAPTALVTAVPGPLLLGAACVGCLPGTKHSPRYLAWYLGGYGSTSPSPTLRCFRHRFSPTPPSTALPLLPLCPSNVPPSPLISCALISTLGLGAPGEQALHRRRHASPFSAPPPLLTSRGHYVPVAISAARAM